MGTSMANNFCRYLTNQIRIEYGEMKPCCWFKDSAAITDDVAVKKFQEKLKNINSWATADNSCSECARREFNGSFSPRKESLQHPSFQNAEDKIVKVEIQIDKDCNGACLICGPWNSTTWEKYDLNIKGIPVKEHRGSKEATSKYIQQLHDAIDFSAAQQILFLGGEPLRTDTHLEFLNRIPHPENIEIRYTTNGSYFPDERTLEVWARFRKVNLQFSIDGIDDHFNYLRWPLRWDQVVNNIKRIKNLQNNIVISTFSYTTTPLSIFYHDRYVAWSMQEFGCDMFTKPWQPRGNTELNLSAIPPALATAIKEKYGSNHEISKLLVPYNPIQHQTMLEYIEFHDQHRKLSWRETFPEVVEYFTVSSL